MKTRTLLLTATAVAVLFCCGAWASEASFGPLEDVMHVTTGVERDFEAPEPGVTVVHEGWDLAAVGAPGEIWFQGTVTYQSGVPVSGATLYFKSMPNGEVVTLDVDTVVTKEDGTYRLLAEYDRYQVTVLHNKKAVGVMINLFAEDYANRPLDFVIDFKRYPFGVMCIDALSRPTPHACGKCSRCRARLFGQLD